MSEKRQLTEANTKMTEMLELYDKNFKVSIIKTLQRAIMSTLEANEKQLKVSNSTDKNSSVRK